MKRTLKKAVSALLYVTMVSALAVGCGSSGKKSSGGDDKESLEVWMPPLSENQDDKEIWNKILEPFEKEHNVKVNVEIIPWGNYEEKYLTGVTSGEGPDVGYMYMEMLGDFIDMGAVESLDDYLTDEEKDNYLYLDNGKIDGKQYCLPMIVGNAIVMCYNKDILAANGITEVPDNCSWDQFIDICKQVKVGADGSSEVYPLVQRWGNPSMSTLNASFYPYLWQSGGSIFNEEGTALAIDSEAGKKAVQFLYDLRFTHNILPDVVTSLTNDDCISYFCEGKTAFVEMESSSTVQFDEANVNWGFITSLTNQEKGTFVASDSLVLMSNAKNKDLAYSLIQYMLDGESMTEYHQSARFAPVAKDEEYHDNPAFKSVYEEDGEQLHTLSPAKGASKIGDTLYKNLQLMIMGEMKPEEVISESVSYADTILNE